MREAMLGAFLCCIVAQGWASELFLEQPPQSYTVVKGDTLWDVAGQFLKNPWDWPQVWQRNPHMPNPDKIYPGDIIELIFVSGEPKLSVVREGLPSTAKSINSDLSRHPGRQRVEKDATTERGPLRTIKVSPKIRVTPLEDAIPSIPLNAIDAFLTDSRVLESENILATAPYILSMERGGLIAGAGETLYARGEKLSGELRDYQVYRQGKYLKDPETGEFLGILANSVGNLSKQAFSGEDRVATMYVLSTDQELRIGDRLLPVEERTVVSDYFPTVPANKNIRGSIIDIYGGVKNIGLYGNVLINVGTSSGLENGDLLAIIRHKTIEDKTTGQLLKLPPKRVGVLMAYRTYQKISFAIVLQASELIEKGDNLRTP